MKKILSKIFNIIKFILMFVSFSLILIGVLFTYKRLDKSILEAFNIFLPFIIIIVLTIVNMFSKKAKVSENLLFNFTSILVFLCIIIIGIRAKFDTNMLLYHKYQINYNPSYLSDNLSSIKVLLYCLSGANLFILLKPLFEDKLNNEKINTEKIVLEKEKLEKITTLESNLVQENNIMEEL